MAMSRDEILAEILERPRESFVPLADSQVIARPGWRQLLTPSVKGGGFNDVSLAVVDEADADRVVDETIAQYARHACRFVWRIGPDSSQHLKARLAGRGLAHQLGHGMARSTELAIDIDPRISIERVTEATVSAFTQAMAAGWEMSPAALAPVNEAILGANGPLEMFLARWDGEPAATAGAALHPRSIYLIGGVVLPAFRGRGLYRALVAARVAAARARGIELATSLARADTSAPILERMGFTTYCSFDSYSFAP